MWIEFSPYKHEFTFNDLDNLMVYLRTIGHHWHLEINNNNTAKINFFNQDQLINFTDYLNETYNR